MKLRNLHRGSFSAALVLLTFCCYAQETEEFVKVTGKVLGSVDSSATAANILYEKMPYYDDMGTASSGADGAFEFHLVKGTNYVFTLTQSGFIKTERQVLVEDSNGDGSMNVILFIEAVAAEEVPEVMSLNNLIFTRGSDQISESSFSELDDLVGYLERNPNMTIQLEGHTDFDGNEEANMKLSEARVDSVKAYLSDQGVKKSRVLTKAFGGTQPLFMERTAEAKAKNRRVAVRVLRR
jgi:OOP family OmpA-OmpF porin